MSEMSPQQAADYLDSSDRAVGFTNVWHAALRVLIDHARAAAPEGGDLADAADALAGAIDTHLGEECTLTDAVRDYPDDGAVWAAVSDLHGLRDRVRDALDRTPAPSVAAPPREDLLDRDGDRWRDHGEDSWWPVTSPKLSNAATASRRWVEHYFGPLVPAAAPGTVRDPEREP